MSNHIDGAAEWATCPFCGEEYSLLDDRCLHAALARAEKAEAEVKRERERFEEAKKLARHARIKAAGLEEMVDSIRQVLTWGHTSVDDLRRDILIEIGEED